MAFIQTKPIQIAGVTYSSNLFLAPMAGYTDRAFNEICYEMGASLAFTEMVSAEAVCRESDKTVNLARPAKNAPHHAIQLFGSDPERCALAAQKLLFLNPTMYDLNCGCPVPKVVKTGAGSALMQHPETVYQIVKQTREALNAVGAEQVALSVKFRSGWDSSHINFMEVAEAAWKGGANLVSLHPRTRAQGYSGTSNWDYLKLLKVESPVPVCGSGDLFQIADVNRLFEETGVDAAMIARGAVGQPWIFQAEGKPYSFLNNPIDRKAPDFPQKIYERAKAVVSIAQKHLLLACQLYGDVGGVREMRKHLTVYTKGLPEGKALRNDLIKLIDLDAIDKAFTEYLDSISPILN